MRHHRMLRRVPAVVLSTTKTPYLKAARSRRSVASACYHTESRTPRDWLLPKSPATSPPREHRAERKRVVLEPFPKSYYGGPRLVFQPEPGPAALPSQIVKSAAVSA